MLKKTLVYDDLDGNPVTEDFHFQITKAEVAEKAMVQGEAYGDRLSKLSMERDGEEIMRQFKSILGDAVGRREGQLMIKEPEVRRHFLYSGAYDAFFLELITSEDSGAAVLTAMFPKNFQVEIEKTMRDNGQAWPTGKPESTPVLTAVAPVLEGESTSEPTAVAEAVSEAAIVTTSTAQPAAAGKDEDPLWLRESRNPTRTELMKMSKDEMQLAAKMREAGLIK